jgi:GNAT superfamily N-acetyltransferase
MIAVASPDMAAALEQLQRRCYPTLSEQETMRAEHFLRAMQVFPEGQLVVLEGAEIVGSTTTMRCHFDFEHPHHDFLTFSDHLRFGTHAPDGPWLYGLDIMVHPAQRQKGIARQLYLARQALAQAKGMAGQLTVGLLNGYGALTEALSAEAYLAQVLAGERYDPTISTQIRIGWQAICLIPNYVDDPKCQNYGLLMKWVG